MDKDISKSVERLLTGHYAPQDVIDVCRAAQQAQRPPLPTKLMTGAVISKSMRQLGMEAQCQIVLQGVAVGHRTLAEASLPVPAALFSDFQNGDEVQVFVTSTRLASHA